ncbi:LSU ribosomal protein L25p [Nitrospira tepida]|uniref:Large ribosomal subunit protein bL25 n=1 Tax=Nitrospira tepida TaxID=2973512 RepID=A0AA86T5B1_9BACT|nr:50S ribosomal protein L25 [Nitrospira tepida]CAI4030622.1 LSU ribosomal protein L25p [Nitrospira tepida]
MKFEVTAGIRDRGGKGVARQLRRNGKIPAVLYGQGECLLLTMSPDSLVKIVKSHAATTALISVTLDGGVSGAKTRTALLRDFQVDPVSGEVLHADLFEVSMDKAIRIKVPVSLIGGTPAGLKEGGVLHHNLRELHVECLPSQIPDAIQVDASGLNIGQGIHVKELQAIEGVRFLDDPDQMVVSVAVPISEAKLEALLTTGPPAEPGKEPEVIAKGKEAAAAKEGAAPAAGEKAGAAAAPAAGAEKKEASKAEKKEAKK